MLPIVWLDSARANLRDITRYIAQESPRAAQRMAQTITASVQPVANYPYLFRVGRVPGTREIVAHPNYIVVYRVTASRIEVLRVLHARQQYP